MQYKNTRKVMRDLANGVVRGCVGGVSKNGKVEFSAAYGYLGEDGTPMPENAVFELWSCSKLITMVAVLKLYERGEFLLQDRVSDYIPEFGQMKKYVRDGERWAVEDLKNPIRVEHLMNMACGIPYGGDIPTGRDLTALRERLERQYGGIHNVDILTEIKEVAKIPVMFEPGTHWMYGYGHDAVAALIVAITGKSMADYLREEITEPLQMHDTGYSFTPSMQGRIAKTYERDKNTFWKDDENPLHSADSRYHGGGSGIISTMPDYLRFATMLANGGALDGEKILSRKTVDLMRTNRLNAVQQREFDCSYNAGYGYGLGVRTMIEPWKTSNGSVGEFGWTGFGGCYTAIDPSERLAMVYMHQMYPNDEERCHHRFRNAVYADQE